MKKKKAQLKAEFMEEAGELFDEMMEWEEQTELGGQESLDTKTVFAKRIFLSRID